MKTFSKKQKLAAIYSMDEKITGAKLKETDIEYYDKKIISNFLQWCKRHKINFKFQDELDWKKTKHKPHIIYYKGNIDLLGKKIIGIVGPRDYSPYAEKILEILFKRLSKYSNQIVTISGLADGVDKMCHRLSMKYNIATIAILGGGIGKYINSSDRHIISDIEKNGGLIISEFKVKEKSTRRSFPQRNRIIAGFSNILFVPQAKPKSGSLITVDFAQKWNIPVYSCFSSIFDEYGMGTNQLIAKKEIIPIVKIDDFIKEICKQMNLNENEEKFHINKEEFNEKQQKIINCINKNIEPTIENINYDTGIGIQELLQEITELEILGIIKQESNGFFSLY